MGLLILGTNSLSKGWLAFYLLSTSDPPVTSNVMSFSTDQLCFKQRSKRRGA